MAADALRRRAGLRLRVAAVSALTVGIALAIAALLLVGLLRNRLDTAATTAATLRARDVAALAEAGTLPRNLALPGEESAFVQVVDQSGAVIASTENIDGEQPIATARPAGTAPLKLTVVVLPLDQADAMRVIALNADTDSATVTVYAGESLEGADDTTAAIITVLGIGLPLLVIIVAAVTWWGVGRTLRPVRSITRTMADITASDLHRRVEVPTARDEIGQLALTVNDTLGRLDTSVERQRRFVADASHELRGPLAALRADLEISVTHPDRTDWLNVARDTLSDVERLQLLTEDLLALARLDASTSRPQQAVDIAALARDAISDVRRTDVHVTAHGLDNTMTVQGDEAQLRRMLRNLVHNAEQHATTHLSIELTAQAHAVTLKVSDDGPGIAPQDRERVFERFVRLDDARTRDSGGTGLGLAIVHDIVLRHDGHIRIDGVEPHGTTIVVELTSPVDAPSH
ncbi:MAG TPA: HAMP domain-containing sensor histidine kinase [Ilumatobacteraceae bacterium]|nr:HAMP domain-containing sensor histidine kinase [Ilumatobacteraceae bacterium]